MGVWGAGLMENDTSCDAQVIYEKCIQEGKTPKQAVDEALKRWKGIDFRRDVMTHTFVYIGLAHAQLNLGYILEDVRTKTITLIDKGATLKGWVSPESRLRHKIELDKFSDYLKRIQGVVS